MAGRTWSKRWTNLVAAGGSIVAEDLATGKFRAHVVGNPSYSMSGTVSAGHWQDPNGTGSYVWTEQGTIAVKDGVMTASGTFSDSNGVHGTWKLAHRTVAPTLTVASPFPRRHPRLPRTP